MFVLPSAHSRKKHAPLLGEVQSFTKRIRQTVILDSQSQHHRSYLRSSLNSTRCETRTTFLWIPAVKFLLPAACVITLSWVKHTQPSSIFPSLLFSREKKLASTGSSRCLDREMMGKGNGKCYPTLSLSLSLACFPFSPSPLSPPSPLLVTFSYFCLVPLSATLPLLRRPAGSAPLCCPVMESFFGRAHSSWMPVCWAIELWVRGEGPEVFIMNTLKAVCPWIWRAEVRRGSLLNAPHHIQERRRIGQPANHILFLGDDVDFGHKQNPKHSDYTQGSRGIFSPYQCTFFIKGSTSVRAPVNVFPCVIFTSLYSWLGINYLSDL